MHSDYTLSFLKLIIQNAMDISKQICLETIRYRVHIYRDVFTWNDNGTKENVLSLFHWFHSVPRIVSHRYLVTIITIFQCVSQNTLGQFAFTVYCVNLK